MSPFTSVGALGPTLIRSSVRTSWSLTQLTGTAARGATAVTVVGPAAVARPATALLRAESQRQIWAVDGRARVQGGGLAAVSMARVDVVDPPGGDAL